MFEVKDISSYRRLEKLELYLQCLSEAHQSIRMKMWPKARVYTIRKKPWLKSKA